MKRVASKNDPLRPPSRNLLRPRLSQSMEFSPEWSCANLATDSIHEGLSGASPENWGGREGHWISASKVAICWWFPLKLPLLEVPQREMEGTRNGGNTDGSFSQRKNGNQSQVKDHPRQWPNNYRLLADSPGTFSHSLECAVWQAVAYVSRSRTGKKLSGKNALHKTGLAILTSDRVG